MHTQTALKIPASGRARRARDRHDAHLRRTAPSGLGRFTKPEILKRWLFGPPGWTFEVCEVTQKLGERYRYVWRGPDGNEMGMGGVIREFTPPKRMVGTEKFDEAWYPGEALVTIELTEQGDKTLLTQTLQYESREARDIVLKSPMEGGVAMSYDRLAEMLTKSSVA
jgi:uncharacterized protein YndB with AHSA1/START domain